MSNTIQIIGHIFLRDIPLAVKRLISPKAIMANQVRLYHHYEKLAAEGRVLEKITPFHSDPKLAALGKAFEEMLEHPIAKKFRRHPKMHLYLNKEEAWGGIKFLSALENMKASPSAQGMNIMQIPKSQADFFTLQELKAAVGHEIGHHLLLDCHPRHGFRRFIKKNQESEILADQISVVLAQEPEATKSALEKLEIFQKQAAEELSDNWLGRIIKKDSRKINNDTASSHYPSANERNALIDNTAAQMATLEGRAHLEEELTRRLQAEHKKLFPHHFNRSTPNFRDK